MSLSNMTCPSIAGQGANIFTPGMFLKLFLIEKFYTFF